MSWKKPPVSSAYGFILASLSAFFNRFLQKLKKIAETNGEWRLLHKNKVAFHDIINIMSSKAFLLYPKAVPLIPAVSFAFLQSPPVHKNARRRRHHHVWKSVAPCFALPQLQKKSEYMDWLYSLFETILVTVLADCAACMALPAYSVMLSVST